MATAEQLKSLIRSHFADDRERFTTIALQLAAHEAKLGHSALAQDIRAMVDKARFTRVRTIRYSRELNDLLIITEPGERLADLIVSDKMRGRIKRILSEFRQRDKLKKYGLKNRRKALLAGPPGTGKTMTAAVIAGELHLPLYTILMDKLVTRFMGETSAKLRQIFDVISERCGVYLFDEFDAIGAERARDNDVGEMRRVLNSFLQFIELDNSESLIIAATNNAHILDQALFRRFDDILYYQLPTEDEIRQLLENRLGNFQGRKLSLTTAVKEAKGLSHAEITQACEDAIKEAILADKEIVTATALKKMLRERRLAYATKKR